MSTPTLDRLNLEEVLGVSDWNPEFACEASKLMVYDIHTHKAYGPPKECPNPATCVIVTHTRKCSAVLSCANCYTLYQQLISRLDWSKGKLIACAACNILFDPTGIWSEPI